MGGAGDTGPSGTRPTIGLIGALTPDRLNLQLWSGVEDVARERDANLIFFPAHALRAPIGFDAQANVLYELVGPENVDGLVVWGGAMAAFAGAEAVKACCERYRPLPMVSVALPLEGIPSVWMDNRQGVYDVVAHLVEVHGRRRIAFIGPRGHPEAEGRYRGYVDGLREHGIPLDPDLVAPGAFNVLGGASGVDAVRLLLDERDAKLEAVVAATDLIATGAIEALRARGVRVPDDVAVVGFDDVPEAEACAPPLTTVSYGMHRQGRRAAEMVLTQMAGASVPEWSSIPMDVIIRQSCGCLAPEVVHAAMEPLAEAGETLESSLATWRQDLLRSIRQLVGDGVVDLPPGWDERLLESYVGELKRWHREDEGDEYVPWDEYIPWDECVPHIGNEHIPGESPGAFLSALGKVLHHVPAAEFSASQWQDVISVLRRHTLPCLLGDGEALSRIENLWQQARVMVGSEADRVWLDARLQAERQVERMREVSEALITSFDLIELANTLIQELPSLGIRSAYLSLYEDPAKPAGWSHLMAAYDERGCTTVKAGGGRFPSRRLVPAGLLPQGRRYSLVVEPLYFRQEQLGFVVLEASPAQMALCNALRGLISSALKGALLFKQSAEARAAAEKADQLKTRLLANVSHELRTPLNTILGYSRIALDTPGSYSFDIPPALLRDFQHIHSSAEHLLQVINDLLDLSRAEIDELDIYPELIDPRPFLVDVFHNMADSLAAVKQEVTWYLELPDRLPLIQVDPVRIRQVLINLLHNASKFTDEGEIALGAEVAPPHLHIWVRDTGIGIPAGQQERIFQPFVAAGEASRRVAGIGLGLSITRRLVALHRGLMTLESEPGRGSTFHIWLPLPGQSDQLILHGPHRALTPAQAIGVTDVIIKPVEGKTLSDAISALRPPGSEGPILIVEDDAEALDLHRDLVAEMFPGYPVCTAADGVAAVASMAEQVPSLVLLDLAMPEMDGFEVLDRMRADPQTRHVPVLVLSGRMLELKDIQRLEGHAGVVLQSKGVLSRDETIAALARMLFGSDVLSPYTGALVKRALAYIHQNYDHPFSRQDIARAVGASEDYLSRVFGQELGLSPWDYLLRFRIQQARALLLHTNDSITDIALQVGFNDRSYFSRVFHRLVGLSPSEYREHS